MSSPLETLGRTGRAPLPDGALRKRRDASKTHSSDRAQEEDLLCGHPTPRPDSLLLPPGVQTARGKLAKPSRGPPVPSDGKLLSVMSTRLAQVEQQMKLSVHEVHDKNQKIRTLEEKIKSLEKMRAAGRDAGGTELLVRGLQGRCAQLQEQVDQMEKSLGDYGLIWGDASSQTAAVTATPRRGWEFLVDFDAVLRQMRELNLKSGEGTSRVERTAGGARLRPVQTVPLTLYCNGIVMFGGPFRPYSDPSTQEFVQDVLDGHFPSELHGRYPDGVPFQVTDRRSEMFMDRRLGACFPGHGVTLGRTGETWRLVQPPAQPTQPTQQRMEQATAERSVSVEQFLSKLPVCVIKRGRVVPVRSALRDLLTGEGEDSGSPTGGLIKVATSVDRAEREGSLSGTGGIANLRVRSESGQERYLLRMEASHTIAHLRAYLDSHSSRQGRSPRYELLSSFPPRVCGDDSASLEALGLVPSSTLIMRAATAAGATAHRPMAP